MISQPSCHRVQRLLDEFAAGSLPAGEAWIVQQHLASCSACAQTLNDFSVLRSAASALEPEAPPAGVEDAVMRRGASQGRRLAPFRRLSWAVLAAPAAAALTLGALVPLLDAPGRPARVATHTPVVSAPAQPSLLALAASDPLADLAAANLVERTGETVGANRDADL